MIAVSSFFLTKKRNVNFIVIPALFVLVTTSEDIDGVLTEHIGPMIGMHGGSIELLNYDGETGNVHI